MKDPKFSKTFSKVKKFINNRKTILTLSGAALVTLVTSIAYPGLATVVLQELGKYIDSALPVNYGGRELTKQTAKRALDLLLEEFQILPNFDLINFADPNLSTVERIRKIEVSLGMIDNISEPKMQKHFIISLVTTITNLYFSDSSHLNLVLQALKNALRYKFLSIRSFNLILTMLLNRNVPLRELLDAIDDMIDDL